MAVVTNTNVLGDLLINEYHPGYCRESKTVANATGSEVTLVVGAPLDDNVMETAAGIAGCDGLVMQKTVIPNGESRKIPVLVRGPAIINTDELPTEDYAGASITMATFLAALVTNMVTVIQRTEPDNQETQTT
jgi:hypothetical protein